METVFQEQLSQSAPLKTITAAKSGDSKALIEMLRVLKTALEAKMESVAPAAEEEVIVKREKVTKKADYEVSDVCNIIIAWRNL